MIRVFTEGCFRTDISLIFSSFLVFYQNKLQGRVFVFRFCFAASVKLLFREVFPSFWFLVKFFLVKIVWLFNKNINFDLLKTGINGPP